MSDLSGPVCHCGQPFRRRRKWYLWDGATCKNCGARLECINQNPPQFIISASTRTPDKAIPGATERVMTTGLSER